MVNTRGKGKAPATNPKQTKKPKTVPATRKFHPKPASTSTTPHTTNDQRFLNPQARARFNEIKGYRVIQERGFNFEKLQAAYPQFYEAFIERDWESLVTMIFKNANKTLAVEFYANARFTERKYLSYCRGYDIDYSPDKINDLLKISLVPEECGAKKKMEESKNWTEEQWAALKDQLCVPGAQWHGGSRTLLKTDFKPEAKAWCSFVVQTLEGTTCTSQIPLPQLLTVSAILDGSPINVGELIAENIYRFAAGSRKSLAHLSMVNWLCEDAGCELFANDIDAPMMKPLSVTHMDVFEKEYHQRLEDYAMGGVRPPRPPPQQQPSSQGVGSSQQGPYPPIHPMQLDYMMGHCNWMNEVSDQEYWNRPRFGRELTETVSLHRRAITGSFDRFDGSETTMDDYFDVIRGRAQEREQEIREDFARGGVGSNNAFGEDTYEEENPNTWIDPDLMD